MLYSTDHVHHKARFHMSNNLHTYNIQQELGGFVNDRNCTLTSDFNVLIPELRDKHRMLKCHPPFIRI